MTLNNKQISQAIISLLPDAIFTLNGDDYENIIWDTNDPKPSLAELEVAFSNLEAKWQADKAAAEAAKADLLAKLGITADEAKLLLG